MSLPSAVALYTTQQITEIEQRFAADSQQGTYPLMLKAGAVALDYLKQRWPNGKKIVIVTGKGNNAGDGFVLAKLAVEQRLQVDLCALVEPEALAGDAARAWQEIPHKAVTKLSLEDVQFSKYDLIVDAMLGTGIKGALREPFHSVIKHINGNRQPVLSLDVPTGVEADTGYVHSDAVKAEATLSFVGHKRGLFTGAAAMYRGALSLNQLIIPDEYFDQQPFQLFAQDWHSSQHKLKPRNPIAHKGDFGHTLIIGGATGMAGAAVLAATASARSGSGLTSLYSSQQAITAINHKTPEVMATKVENSQMEQMLARLSNKNICMAIGPGLGRSNWAESWLNAIQAQSWLTECAQVWDADALNLLAELADQHPLKFNAKRILTPHPGEAARLLGCSTEEVASDRFAAAQEIAQRYGGVCILKGAGTIISDDKGVQIVCAVGNPGMASGGMGDVLCGLVTGLLAQKYSLMDAALLAVSIHGEAADRAAGRHQHYRGLLASDLFQHFPALLNP